MSSFWCILFAIFILKTKGEPREEEKMMTAIVIDIFGDDEDDAA